MVKVDLGKYCDILISKTNSGEYLWEQAGDNKYRLVIPKGAIMLEKGFRGIHGDYYEVSFYGTNSLIYSCALNAGNSFFKEYSNLYETIISKNNERVNKEITDLFED